VSISDIRDGIATNLATISGLRTSADLPDNPSPPIAVVQLNNVQYDEQQYLAAEFSAIVYAD